MSTTDTSIMRELPDGSTLEFIETDKSRGYYHVTDGKRKRYPSVTTILGVIAKPALLRWSEAQGAAGALAAVRMGELDPKVHADEEAVDVVRMLGLGADAAKQKAADRGLSIHDALEVYCSTGLLPSPADLKADERPYLQGLGRALLALDPEPTQVEQVTCDPTFGYAGRFDLRARVNGLDSLCDLKTAKGGRGFPEAHLQLDAYASAEMALGEPYPEQMLVVAVGPDGSFAVDECSAPAGSFFKVLEVYRLMAEVRKPIEAARRAAKKAAA